MECEHAVLIRFDLICFVLFQYIPTFLPSLPYLDILYGSEW